MLGGTDGVELGLLEGDDECSIVGLMEGNRLGC